MKLNIEQPLLAGALAYAKSVVQARNTIPVLSNVLLSASDKGLHIAATDLDMRVETNVECNVETIGNITVSAVKLFELVKRLSSDKPVNIELENSIVTVKQGRSRFKLNTLPHTDFPEPMEVKDANPVTIDARSLHDALSNVSYAASTEETRYMLNGVYFHHDGGKLITVATDGGRMSLAKTSLEDTFDQFILPSRSVNEFLKVTDKASGDITLIVGKYSAKIDLGHTSITTKFVDATFPEYHRVIPSDASQSVITGSQELISAINRVTTLADNSSSRRVDLIADNNILKLSFTGVGGEEANDEVSCEFDGQITRSFNSKFLIDALNQIKSGVVKFDFVEDERGPIKLTDNDNQESNMFIIMPMGRK